MVKREGGDIYLLCGEEGFLKEEASKEIISKSLPPESQDLNRETYSAKDNYRDIFDTLNTFPLLFDKRAVVIKDIEYLPEAKRRPFLTYLRNSPRGLCLILHSNETLQGNKFIKEISQYAQTSRFKRLYKAEVRDWIYKRLSQYKKSMTKEALELLLELKGSGNLALLSKELEKLVTYKDETRTITREDVIELVGKGLTKRAFDLVEAISFKDRDSAMLLVGEFSSSNKRGVPEIMGLMGWQLRRLWKAKRLLAKKKNKYRIAEELNVKSFSIDKFLDQVNRFNTEELKRNFRLLVEADRSMKIGRSRPRFILEQLVMKLCSV